MKYEEIVKHMLTKLDEEISDADTYLNMAEAQTAKFDALTKRMEPFFQ